MPTNPADSKDLDLGPTGRYPSSQPQNDEDHGELKSALFAVDGLIRIEFGQKVGWLSLTTPEARILSSLLIRLADQIEGQG